MFSLLANQSLIHRLVINPRTTRTSTRLLASSPSSSPPAATTVSKHYIPRSQRTANLSSIYEFDSLYDQRLKRRRRIDPTRELNYTSEHWERHKSVYRRIRHILTTFGSSPFQRLLFPDFFVTSLIAGGLTYYNEVIAASEQMMMVMNAQGFGAATTAIAIMTGFRLNASYGRYTEARKLLGRVHSSSRDLASNTCMWIKLPKDRERMMRLIKAFSVGLTFHLNKKGAHHNVRRCLPSFQEQIYAEFRAELLDIFLDPNDGDYKMLCEWFSSEQNIPLGIATAMRRIIAENDTKDAFTRELDIHVHRLVESLGGCERIQKTPIPTCFTRHTSRLLFVWSNLMPFALYPVCGVYTLPVTIGVSFSVLAIEDTGVQLEEPFNILPLRQYADNVIDSVDFVAAAYEYDGTHKDW